MWNGAERPRAARTRAKRALLASVVKNDSETFELWLTCSLSWLIAKVVPSVPDIMMFVTSENIVMGNTI